MKVIKTVPSDLHIRVQESMRKLTPEELKRKQFQRRREEFLKRVYQTLGKNFIGKEEK